MEKLVYYFIYFFVFSVVGYICEVTYVYICNKKLVNRGFLHGPYIPIYGNGAIFITLALGQCKNVILVLIFELVAYGDFELLNVEFSILIITLNSQLSILNCDNSQFSTK